MKQELACLPIAAQLLSSPPVNFPSQKMVVQTKSPLILQLYSWMRPQILKATKVPLYPCLVNGKHFFMLIRSLKLLVRIYRIRTTTLRKTDRSPLGKQQQSKARPRWLQASTSSCPERFPGLAQPAFPVVTVGLKAHPVSLLLSQPDPLGPSSPECHHCPECTMWVHWLLRLWPCCSLKRLVLSNSIHLTA